MNKKAIIPILIFLICAGITTFGQSAWRPGEMEIRVELRNFDEAKRLNNLGFNGDIYAQNGYAVIYLTLAELELLEENGFAYEILKNDLNHYFKNFWPDRDQYHSYEEIISVIDSLSNLYPTFCKKIDFGLSVEGRQLCALKISDYVNTDEPEPEVMFDGGIHGDEIGGPENLVRFAKHLCDNYGTDPQITSLIDEREIWLYIMVNPDGRVNMSRYNSNGVDLNRDWGYMWNGTGGSPGYYSQVETRALRSCAQSNQFAIHITYHSGTVFLAYPWSYRPDSCPDQAHIQQLGNVYAGSSGYDYLPVEQGYTGMYPISGSSKDANYAVMGSVSWTMEISTDKQPPASQIQYFYEINEPAMTAVLERAGFGLSGTVMDANLGIPVAATIFVNDYYPCYSDPVIGDYHKYLLAGVYSVTAVANGYQPLTHTVTITEGESTELNFSLQHAYNQFAYRVLACRIPIANFEDEGMTYAALWEPDGINYSLGRSGWIILDMQQEIPDGPGNEIVVYEGGSDPEGYACSVSASMDGPWALVGNGTGTASFNLGASGLNTARYIRIEDNGEGPVSGDNAGFDLDAVEIPEQPDIVYLLIDCQVDDPEGNNNNRVEPGENFNLIVSLQNIGSLPMEDGQAYLNIAQEFLNITNPELLIEDLAYGESTQLSFSMSCSWTCPLEELLMTVLNITSNEGFFQQSVSFNFTSGAIIEDWETVGFNKFDWANGGDKLWAMSFLNPFQGTCSAKSGNIDNDQETYLQVTMDVIGYDDISFYRKVSSESGSDFLRFYIDNNLAGEWSGELSWGQESYQVTPGPHTFRWAFEKDNLNSIGSDCGWLDYIVFPSCNLDGTLKVIANAIPHEFCGQGGTQLGAYILGGSGNSSFQWQPALLMDDPASQFPTASLDTITVFSVEVIDGADTTGSNVQVNSYTLPATPFIYQEGDSLISSVETGNQWYDNGGLIQGATGQVFYPQTETSYFVLVTNEFSCISDTSNIIHFIFTDVTENTTGKTITIYPNPFNDIINIHFDIKPMKEMTVKIIDITGHEIIEKHLEVDEFQEDIQIQTRSLKNGLYLFNIYNHESKLLVSKKIIKI